MEENKRHIDDFLREELGNYTETPPPAVWEDLEKRLDNTPGRKGFDFRKWWWMIPALLFVAGGSFLAAHKWSAKNNRVPQKTEAPGTSSPADSGYTPGNANPHINQPDTDTAIKHPAVNQPDTPAGKQATAAPVKGKNNRTDARKPIAVANNAPAKTATGTHTAAHPAENTKDPSAHAITHTRPATPAAGNAAITPSHNKRGTISRTAHKQASAKTQATAPTTRGAANTSGDIPAVNNTTGDLSKNSAATQTANRPNQKPAPETAANTPVKMNQPEAVAPQAEKPVRQKTRPNNPQKPQPVTAANNNAKTNRQPEAVAPQVEKPVRQKTRPNNPQKPQPVTAASNDAKTNRQPEAVAPQAEKPVARQKTRPNNPQKPQPVTAANNDAKTNRQPEALAPQAGKSIVNNNQDRHYTFKSKTGNAVKEKSKGNLDLSDKQAEAEADTASEREMDPYASLNPPNEKQKLRFEAGIKAGYSYGFNDFALNKITAAPYLQFNINTKLSVGIHLGFSYGQMSKTALTDPQSYYKITGTSLQIKHDTIGGQIDSFFSYRYSQSRDSFSVKYATAKSLWEIEIPVILKYNLGADFSLFGGPVFTFGKVIQISQEKSQTYTRQIKDSIIHTLNQYNIAYFNNQHQPSGAPDSTLTNDGYQNPTSTPVRIGYTLGVSYNAGKRVMIDVSMQQMLSGASFIPNEQVRKVYTQPYFRVAIGFRLFK